jgi:hypothetical protein
MPQHAVCIRSAHSLRCSPYNLLVKRFVHGDRIQGITPTFRNPDVNAPAWTRFHTMNKWLATFIQDQAVVATVALSSGSLDGELRKAERTRRLSVLSCSHPSAMKPMREDLRKISPCNWALFHIICIQHHELASVPLSVIADTQQPACTQSIAREDAELASTSMVNPFG